MTVDLPEMMICRIARVHVWRHAQIHVRICRAVAHGRHAPAHVRVVARFLPLHRFGRRPPQRGYSMIDDCGMTSSLSSARPSPSFFLRRFWNRPHSNPDHPMSHPLWIPLFAGGCGGAHLGGLGDADGDQRNLPYPFPEPRVHQRFPQHPPALWTIPQMSPLSSNQVAQRGRAALLRIRWRGCRVDRCGSASVQAHQRCCRPPCLLVQEPGRASAQSVWACHDQS